MGPPRAGPAGDEDEDVPELVGRAGLQRHAVGGSARPRRRCAGLARRSRRRARARAGTAVPARRIRGLARAAIGAAVARWPPRRLPAPTGPATQPVAAADRRRCRAATAAAYRSGGVVLVARWPLAVRQNDASHAGDAGDWRPRRHAHRPRQPARHAAGRSFATGGGAAARTRAHAHRRTLAGGAPGRARQAHAAVGRPALHP